VADPIDRLPYADCASIESALSGHDGEKPMGADASLAAPEPADAAGLCPVCRRDRRAAEISAEELDALQFRFWSADHRQFDHVGFARAVMAAGAD
jgi:hypothetical protein